MMKKKTRKIVYPILLLFILYIISGMVLSKRQQQLIFKPEKLDSSYSFKTVYPHKEFNIPIDATSTLNILYLYTDSVRGQVLYFPGNSGNIATHLPLLPFFLKRGYNVFILDYPGFGKSTGTPSEKELYQDAEILYQLATEYTSGDHTLIYGAGLGSGVAAYLASRKKCKALVLQSPFYSLTALARHYFPIYPVKKYLKYSFPVYHDIQRTFAPVVIFHGEKDHTIPFSQAKKLAALLSPKDRFVALPHANHDNVMQQPLYKHVMDSILVISH